MTKHLVWRVELNPFDQLLCKCLSNSCLIINIVALLKFHFWHLMLLILHISRRTYEIAAQHMIPLLPLVKVLKHIYSSHDASISSPCNIAL
jgi:hypothetical protein